MTGLPRITDAQIVAYMLVLSRVGMLFMLAPIFSSRMIPTRAKLIAAGGISLALTPIAMRGQEVPVDPFAVGQLLVKEMIIGTAFAFTIAALTAAVSFAASILDTLIGFSFGAVLDPITGAHNAILGQVYSVFAAAIFIVTGGAEVMVMGLARSYSIVSLASFPDTGTLAALATSAFAALFVTGLQIAAPPLIALLVADAAFAIVARAVPQMNVFIVGLPAKIMLGFATIAASLPFLSDRLSTELQLAVATALRGLGAG